ncbi:putative O-linked N-acetylglucosamine transferase, SPINDLY family [Thalassovita gelatinovora]|uniref:Putative O-linked N-acetylglucosamine transferase, SPINDLY family n=1 Tax=Thalassovita gelatinovora TaxID=53501 RepID=A0A0P1FC84_THAGE|nr:tetratricopeptide repeat protein [Thalassovita gelatinovora]QIZ80039.1 tetratricopeptide repeat protein [Thalassovita gelatinovora]CUH65748.1 putative O-linked N-acetylglucosamine transferase, SPINDLY family [Thalassovita gelatinovora]SER03924.1 TPR repeat-containing protein [Thalassovita gelatinovora]
MNRLIALVFLFFAPMASACPDAPDHSVAVNDLLQRIQDAPNEYQARLISNQLWALWADAPDEAAQAVLDRGMGKRRAFDLIGALEDFDRLIAYCPDYAEGYNQRAFVRFLQQDYDRALIDLDRALALSPTHVAALTGKALTLIGLGRNEEGQAVLRLAVNLNPWLPERNLLQTPKGKEL